MSAVKRTLENQIGADAEAQRQGVTDYQRILEQPSRRFTQDERSIILDTCCGGASKDEAEQLIAIAEARGLNPLAGECYFVQRYDSEKQRRVWAVQASIDSFRIKAEETGLYDGQDEPEYEYDDKGQLLLARVRIYRKDFSRPCVGVARYEEYVQRNRGGDVTRFWRSMPHNQLAKCAEALALRKAFPRRLAGLYTSDEMQQAKNDEPEPKDRASFEPKEHTVTSTVYLAKRDAIESAQTMEQLQAAWSISMQACSPAQVADLRARKDRRKSELTPAAHDDDGVVQERQPGED